MTREEPTTMGDESERGFWARRLARNEWLGLHLTLGLVACLALAGCFLWLAFQVRGPQPPGVDQRIYERLRENRENSPVLRAVFLHVTDMGTFSYVTAVVLLGAAVLAWQRRFRFAVVWVLVIATAPLVNSGVKHLFQRSRPAGIDPLAPEESYSFPSGHSMESMIAYGMLAYLLLLTLPPRRWLRRAGVAALALLILTIGFSRMYLSAHWFTDVMGGFSLGAAWAAFWIAILECGRRRSAGARRMQEVPLSQTPGGLP